MHHGGAHGEEGEDEGDEGLALGDQVPVGTAGGGALGVEPHWPHPWKLGLPVEPLVLAGAVAKATSFQDNCKHSSAGG